MGKEKTLVVGRDLVEKGVVRGHVHGQIPLQWGCLGLERLRGRLHSSKEVEVVEAVFLRNHCLLV